MVFEQVKILKSNRIILRRNYFNVSMLILLNSKRIRARQVTLISERPRDFSVRDSLIHHLLQGDDERRLSEMIRLNEQKIADEMERRTRSDQTKRNLESEIRNCKHELQKIDSQLQKNNSIERNYTKQLDDTRKDLGKFLDSDWSILISL